MQSQSYRSAILNALAAHRLQDLDDNYDLSDNNTDPAPQRSMWKRCMGGSLEGLKAARSIGQAIGALSPLHEALCFYLTPKQYFARTAAEVIQQGEYLYNLLADDASKDLLVKLIAFRILGHRKVRLPRNTPQYWEDIARVNSLSTDDPLLPIETMGLSLAVKDVSPLGYDMKFYAGDGGVACCLVQKQYEYHHGNVHVKAEAGDVVVDAGVCWGETSIYFAHEVGPTGKVLSFEFIPSNLEVARRNLDMNPHLKDRILLVEQPLWSGSGLPLAYVDWGPGSRVTSDPDKLNTLDGIVHTTTIDESLALAKLDKIDFIKMDIEGAELESLYGAEQSIRKYRPKLAISLYHKPDDYKTIPRYLAGLDLNYRFYLEHHTIFNNETVLFAMPDSHP